MKLSILIPTYNRSLYLKKNLELLKKYLRLGKLQSQIEIVVSNNHSPDDTSDLISRFKSENEDIDLKYHLQCKNIGLENNALFVLKESIGDYVMYLGDDDFIEFEYLEGVIEHITNNRKTNTVIPSCVAVDINGNLIYGNRDVHLPNKLYKSGFNNCLENSWRGHQLSGLVFKRNGLYESYIDNKVSNIYLFIYFTSISCLAGDTYHFTKYPIRITSPGQENKDWGYGKDGLINEIFDNYKKLSVGQIEKTRLELKIIRTQPTRIWSYRKINNKAFFSAFRNIWFSKNSTFYFKLLFPIEIFRQYIYRNFLK